MRTACPCFNHYKLNVDSSWNVLAHGDAREGKWRGNWRMEWVASTLHTTSKRGVSSITTADAHTSVASSRLNWRPRRFKWTCPFRRKTKSGFWACAITFQRASTTLRHLKALDFIQRVYDRFWHTHNLKISNKRSGFQTPYNAAPSVSEDLVYTYSFPNSVSARGNKEYLNQVIFKIKNILGFTKSI